MFKRNKVSVSPEAIIELKKAKQLHKTEIKKLKRQIKKHKMLIKQAKMTYKIVRM